MRRAAQPRRRDAMQHRRGVLRRIACSCDWRDRRTRVWDRKWRCRRHGDGEYDGDEHDDGHAKCNGLQLCVGRHRWRHLRHLWQWRGRRGGHRIDRDGDREFRKRWARLRPCAGHRRHWRPRRRGQCGRRGWRGQWYYGDGERPFGAVRCDSKPAERAAVATAPPMAVWAPTAR